MRLLVWFSVLAVLGWMPAGASESVASPPLRTADEIATRSSPHWAQMEAGLARINFDGLLRLSFAIPGTEALNTLGIRCALEHRVVIDARGQARSAWRFHGLSSSLAPFGRHRLRWQTLRGAPVFFSRMKTGRSFTEAGSSPWLIREVGTGEGSGYEVRSPQGATWRYESGYLVRCEHPMLGEFVVATQGALIREIRCAESAEKVPPLLQAKYDANAHTVTLSIGGGTSHQFTWNEAGELVRWKKTDGVDVVFVYRNGLLAEWQEGVYAAQRIDWAQNPGWQRGDSQWPSPVRLRSDNQHDYDYAVTAKGAVITVTDKATGLRTKTTFNPRRGRLEQLTGDSTLLMTFAHGRKGSGALQRIATGEGKILEDYVYNARGQLVAIRFEDGSQQLMTYDDAGRLMGFEERKAQ